MMTKQRLIALALCLLLVLTAVTTSRIAPQTDSQAAFIPLGPCSQQLLNTSGPDQPGAGSNLSIHIADDIAALTRLLRSQDIKIVFIGCPESMQILLANPHLSLAADSMLHGDCSAKAAPGQSEKGPEHPEGSARPPVAVTAVKQPKTVQKTSGRQTEANDSENAVAISATLTRIIGQRSAIIEKYAADPLIIKALRTANSQTPDLSIINERDRHWIAGEQTQFVNAVLTSNVSKFLRKKVLSNKLLYTEAFLCDKRGCVVGVHPRTTDYWQGDEEKFTEAFNAGRGRMITGPLEFDESTDSYAVQVSVPVFDAGKTIGVLIMGIRNIK